MWFKFTLVCNARCIQNFLRSKYNTEQGGSGCSAYDLCSYRTSDVETEGFVGFTQFLQANAEDTA